MESKNSQSNLTTMCCGAGGCLAALAALLWPVFMQTKTPVRSMTCLANVKQMGVNLAMYAQDYDGRFPRAAEWMDEISPYIKNDAIYHCPSVKDPKSTEYGYAFNATLELKLWEKIKNPSTVISLYDSNDLRRNATARNRAGVANPPRHSGGDNFGFADGHAKWLRLAKDPGEEK